MKVLKELSLIASNTIDFKFTNPLASIEVEVQYICNHIVYPTSVIMKVKDTDNGLYYEDEIGNTEWHLNNTQALLIIGYCLSAKDKQDFVYSLNDMQILEHDL